MKRIRRLLDPVERPRAVLMPVLSAGILILAASLTLTAFQSAQKTPERPWQHWLQEDVAYIITDQERSAFLRLEDAQEREMFVKQFWERRNPVPGSGENAFKIEHYRRIAYANEHYSSNLPGWKTDRGRIYITYGPPDEIESHPSGSSSAAAGNGGGNKNYPFEQWLYRYIGGIGKDVMIEFEDKDATGDYRMTRDPDAK